MSKLVNTFEWDAKYKQSSQPSDDWRPTTDKLTRAVVDNRAKITKIDTELTRQLTDFYNNDYTPLKNDEAALGQQVQEIQSNINELVRKQTTLDDLCRVEHCPWAIDIQSQIDSNGTAIKRLEQTIGGIPGVPSHDILFMTTREVTVNLRNQSLVGGAYWYDFEYDITEWDNATYQLEGLIYKNLHKDDSGNHGQVEPNTRKALVSLTYDDSKMYGTIYTQNTLDTGSLSYRLVVTCLWKKVLNRDVKQVKKFSQRKERR